MGVEYPHYELPPYIISQILELLDVIKKENFPASKLKEITYRPLRPDEINKALTIETRVYNTTKTAVGYERILGATEDLKVKTGSIYIFLGWICIDDPTGAQPMGLGATGQILVEGVLRNEVDLSYVNAQENNGQLTLSQVIVANEDTSVRIQVKTPKNATAELIAYPYAIRMGPKAQLDVT